jgi:hypothetical protein
MNELQALMGLECLKAMPGILASRAEIHAAYREAFAGRADVKFLDPRSFPSSGAAGFSPNYAYCPVLFKDLETRERVYAELKEKCNVFTRRYFYPLLTDFAPYSYGRGTCPVAEDAARQSDARWIPEVLAPVSFRESLALAAETTCFVGALVEPPARPILAEFELRRGECAAKKGGVSVFVGPEGDFTPEELSRLLEVAHPVSLGPTVLRAETAAVFALGAVSAAIQAQA